MRLSVTLLHIQLNPTVTTSGEFLKVVHLTDVHVQTRPRVSDMTLKRVLGSLNLYALGRHAKFSTAAQQAAITATIEANPDVVIFTGDLTAQSLDSEFEAARGLLQPILDKYPTVLIPGNHDTYVSEVNPGERMRLHFSEWMRPSPHLHRFGEIGFLHIETCTSDLLSRGQTTTAQLSKATQLLAETHDCFVFVCLHYPLLNRHGSLYGPSSRANRNATDILDWLAGTDRVGAVLHGHEHHGFTVDVHTKGGMVPIFNPGASGYSHLPKKRRTSHINIYDVDKGGIHNLRRLQFDGTSFHDEPGGAYATRG